MEPLTLEQARTRFPGAMEALEELQAPYDEGDQHSVLYVDDEGYLVVGDTLDGFFDRWLPEERRWTEDAAAQTEWSDMEGGSHSVH